jgi:D-arabinose 1-dehydrogenase-like Zn-dependent alcohol dehydrogenase
LGRRLRRSAAILGPKWFTQRQMVSTVEGHMPGYSYPRIPGHEVIGVIDALGPDVEGWDVGARVGVGWFGGSCG